MPTLLRPVSSVFPSFIIPFFLFCFQILSVLYTFIYPSMAHKTSVANADIITTAHPVSPSSSITSMIRVSIPAMILAFFPKQTFSSSLSILFSFPTGAIFHKTARQTNDIPAVIRSAHRKYLMTRNAAAITVTENSRQPRRVLA